MKNEKKPESRKIYKPIKWSIADLRERDVLVRVEVLLSRLCQRLGILHEDGSFPLDLVEEVDRKMVGWRFAEFPRGSGLFKENRARFERRFGLARTGRPSFRLRARRRDIRV